MRLRRILEKDGDGELVERVRLPESPDVQHLERLLRDADARLLQLEAGGDTGGLLEQLHDHVVEGLTACSRLRESLGDDGHEDRD